MDNARDDVTGRQIDLAVADRGCPSRSTRCAPSPLSASVARGAGSRPTSMAVGWNCTNSGSAIVAPTLAAIAIASPRAVTGLVVTP